MKQMNLNLYPVHGVNLEKYPGNVKTFGCTSLLRYTQKTKKLPKKKKEKTVLVIMLFLLL